ncbi:YfbM family protein [Nocardia sp. NBC_01377]|uniref:YfbM family protein n=1 Tax=Nocardia sp. NBC_01377 TaxID=2903595 RepID=UPI00324F9CB0
MLRARRVARARVAGELGPVQRFPVLENLSVAGDTVRAYRLEHGDRKCRMGMVVSFTAVTEAQLARLVAAPDSAWELLHESDSGKRGPSGYIDKAWAGLDYLFTRAGVGVDLFVDGEALGEDGELYAWSPALVSATAATLKSTPFATLAAHFDAVDMDERDIYPPIWKRDGDDIGLGYLGENYTERVRFFVYAAKSGSGAVMSFG